MKYRFEMTEEAVEDLIAIINQDPTMGNKKYGSARIVDNKIMVSSARFNSNGEVSSHTQAIIIPFEKIDEPKEAEEYLGYR